MTIKNFKNSEYLGIDHKLGKYGYRFYTDGTKVQDLSTGEILVMRAEVGMDH